MHWWPIGETDGTEERSYKRGPEGTLKKIIGTTGTVTFGYEALGNVTSIVARSPSSQSPLRTTLTYDQTYSRPTSITDPLGRTTSYSYDANGNLTRVTDPMGLQNTMSYDPDGQLTAITDPQGNTTHYSYAQGDQVSATDPLGHETRASFDAAGRPIGLRDPLGGLTQLEYDEDNNLTSATNPAGQSTSYTYDQDSDLTSITDARGHTQTGVYNNNDEMTSWTDALGKATHYTYDDLREVENVSDPNGQTTHYHRDDMERLTEITFGATGGGSPTSSIAYTYNRRNGDLETIADSRAGTYTLTHDTFHRLTGLSGPNGSIGYTYDAAGQSQSTSLEGETAANYTYNADGQPTAIETPHGNVALHYDSDGRPAQVQLPNSDTENYTYDNNSQLAGIAYRNPEGEALGDLQYNRDPLGRITTLSGSMARTNLPAAVSENEYNASNELTSSEGHTFSYDEDGNLTNDGTSSYTWNDRNQLTGVTQGTDTWNYAYDPLARRIEKTHGSTHTHYRYDGPNVTTELTGSEVTAQLLNGLGIDEHYARTAGGETSSYLTDAQNSTLALTAEDGTPTTEYTYDPFGATTHTGASTTNPYQYTGLQTDENGLQNSRARYYNPTTSRFISQDPLGAAGSGTNLYQYTPSDPVNFTDPTGYESVLDAIGNGYTSGMDSLTGGATRAIRGVLGIGNPDYSSASGQIGGAAGLLGALLIPGDEESALADEANMLRHYTNDEGAAGILESGRINPSKDGYTYLTPDEYADGPTAQEQLSLRHAPTGYFKVPISKTPTPEPVGPGNGQPGGGSEVRVPGSVNLPSGTTFHPFG